jgi:hypothetical protein
MALILLDVVTVVETNPVNVRHDSDDICHVVPASAPK